MSLLNVSKVSHDFGGRRILEDASFRLLKGEHVGLVGANGEGKSTFLNIIIGNVQPEEGTVEWSKNVRVGYLDQHAVLTAGMTIEGVLTTAFDAMHKIEEKMLSLYEKMAEEDADTDKLMEEAGELQHILEDSGYYEIPTKIGQVADGLGLLDLGLDRDVTELSGGQRTKVLLAKLLLEDPSILLLDEPTNYLDVEHINWLRRYLNEYENAFILISHDVEFLNDVVNVIYHIDDGELSRYPGDYENYLRMHEIKVSQAEAAYKRQQAEIGKLKEFVAKNKARAATAGMANSREKILDKMEVLSKPREKAKPEFHFKKGKTSGKVLVDCTDLVIGYDSALTSPLNFKMIRGDKLAIVGTNGLGKSTLLKTILGELKPFSGKAQLGDYLIPAYFEQEAAREGKITALEYIWEKYPSYTNGEVRSALAQCGLTTDHITSQMKVLSGGENAKVRLCDLMQRESNWLILDEPTNHLDVDAKEELKKALREYEGSILIVCHEPSFYEDWVTDVWNVEDWTTKIV